VSTNPNPGFKVARTSTVLVVPSTLDTVMVPKGPGAQSAQ
jgi:hypothetical protein